jgi:hypothetical protein
VNRVRASLPCLILAVVCAPAYSARVEQNAEAVNQYGKLELTVAYLSFSDVPWDHWAFKEVEACCNEGIVSGYDDGRYRPEWIVDRAQMAAYIARALAGGDANVPVPPGWVEPTFLDVPRRHWAHKYIEYAFAQGVVRGYRRLYFAPNAIVDRGQMAAFVARALAGGEENVPDPGCDSVPFADITCDHWARKYVEYIEASGAVNGYPDGSYRPEAACSRDQIAVCLARALALPTYGNLWDPDEFDIVGLFTTPSHEEIGVPGFYCRPFTREAGLGPHVFRVRFAWGEVGDYTYEVMAGSPHGELSLGSGSFTVTESDDRGYVRRSAAAPLYFEFESGGSYFAIGENMCWPLYAGTVDYEEWLPKLASHGGNYIHLWVSAEWNLLALEHLPLPDELYPWDVEGDQTQLGRYDEVAAWRLDRILELANQLGVKAMVCAESYHSLTGFGDWGWWARSPYNAANGGPCEHPHEFFTKEEAKRLFKRRLRYLVARYGYETSVLSWELFTEPEGVWGYSPTIMPAWHQEMAQYLSALDPWDHLITTSFAQKEGEPAVDGLAEIDYVQSHAYGTHDVAGMVASYGRRKTEAYGKPHYIGEFGAGGDEANLSDPEGLNLHNALWSSMLSRSAGTAMIWGWNWYVDGHDLYHRFRPVADFAADVDWVSENYDYGDLVALEFLPGHEPTGPSAMAIEPWAGDWWGPSACNQPHTFTVGNDGTVSDMERLSDVRLAGNTATFLVDYPMPGRFEVIVYGVSERCGSALSISLDGVALLEEYFHQHHGDDVVTHDYDGSYGIDVPAGSHTIVVDNPCVGWFYASYRLTHYLTSPNLRVLSLSNPTSALVWVQNKMHTWWNHAQDVPPEPVNACQITLGGFSPGTYAVEQWDTSEGTAVDLLDYVSADGTVVLATPAGLTTDLAYKVRRK